MNNKFQLIVVSLLSLATGVLGTLIFQSSQKSVELVRSAEFTTEEKKEDSREASKETSKERRPFFVHTEAKNNEPSAEKNEKLSTVEAPTSVDSNRKKEDYFLLSKKMNDLQNKIYEAIGKHYGVMLRGNPRYKENMETLSGRLSNFFDEKKTWFKATVEVAETGGTRMYFFMNYYKCGSFKKETKYLPENVCFSTWLFLKHKGNWQHYSVSSSSESYNWKDDAPHVILYLEHVGDFSRDYRLLNAIIPIPEDEGPLQLVRYENDKISWIEAGRVIWQPSTEKEAKKFQKEVNDFSIKQAERSGQ